MKLLAALIVTAFAFAAPAQAQAQMEIAPGTKMQGRLEADFSGQIVEVVIKNKKSAFRATVSFDGNFQSGMPFTGAGMVQFITDSPVAVGDPIEGRFRANAAGEIVERSLDGIFFTAEGDIFRGEWMTRTQFGGTSKGGGTNVFKLERGEMNVAGSSGGNDI